MSRCATDLGVVDPVQLVAMHKAKADAETADSTSSDGSNGAAAGSSAASNGAVNGSSSSSDSTSDAGASTMSAGSVAGFGAGQVDSLCQYDAESDRFVGGAAGAGKNGHKATAEEHLVVNGNGGPDMTQKGAEWGLLQLDLSFAWSMEDKPVDDVEQMLQEAAVQVSASTR